MAAVAFDPLAYTHDLEASGVSREQAEVHAKAMTAMFLHNVEALVTQDYLDVRFTEFENRVEANIDKRFAEVGQRFAEVEQRFIDMENSQNGRFAAMEAYIDKCLAGFRLEMHGYIAELKSTQKLQSWMLAVLIAGVFMPLIQGYFG